MLHGETVASARARLSRRTAPALPAAARLGAAAALLVAVGAGPVLAQSPPAAPTADEQRTERGLTNLGLMVAHAFQCTPEADRLAAQERLLAFNAMVVAQMGANAAFRFATAFGAGASHDVDRAFCERSLADWGQLVRQNRLDR